jgi:co-chaperonin GroES (HSP10)
MLRMTSDNVLIQLEPLETQTKSGIFLPDLAKGSRRQGTELRKATVLAIGPGHNPGCKKCGGQKSTFIPTSLKPGDKVLVPALAGEDYILDVSAPRHYQNAPEFKNFDEHEGELRIVREEQIVCAFEAE